MMLALTITGSLKKDYLCKGCNKGFHLEAAEFEGNVQVGICGGLAAKLCLILANPWTVAHHAPLSMRFSRQGYWSGLPFLSPGDLPDPGIEP